ncbi:MAG: hypothetical protein GYB66_08965 [Chloroflexi bacterium]|nr:hypothetical protein [Chloroflexota bacterium]
MAFDLRHNHEGTKKSKLTDGPRLDLALQKFDPHRFGFQRRSDAAADRTDHFWEKTLPGIGRVYFTPLSWQHANQQTTWRHPDGTMEHISVLGMVALIQRVVWGIHIRDAIPANVLSLTSSTGGYLGVAYRAEVGFTSEGWLGFVFGLGSIDGVLESHMLAVNPELQSNSIGWHLKLLQAYEALRTGHHAMVWTFDPMRGINANLNFNKLGVYADDFMVSKYGEFHSELYGNVPSDRFIVTWSLTAPRVHEHLRQVYAGTYTPLTWREVSTLPTVDSHHTDEMLAAPPRRLRFEIPGDVDDLAQKVPERAIEWRREMRGICTQLLDTLHPVQLDDGGPDPAQLIVRYTRGTYRVTDFVTVQKAGQRQSAFVFTLKDET